MSDEAEKIDKRRGPRQKVVDDSGRQVVPGTVVEKDTSQFETLPPPVAPTPEMTLQEQADLSQMTAPIIEDVPQGADNVRVIHFVEDGWTALGKLFYRGEELTVQEGSATWVETVDRTGFSWLDLSEDDQIDRYGKVMFRNGPWRGKGYDAAEFGDSAAVTPEELKRLEKRRQRQAAPPLAPSR